jgi:thiol-disulfide isomerase/thioredoxin
MSDSIPDALLFITPGCPHCPAVLQALSDLLKLTSIGKLTVINVVAHPELAAEHGVRSAPWLQLGPYTLTGLQTPAELKQWLAWSKGEAGIAHYVEHLLKEGGFKQAGLFIAEDPLRLKSLLSIVADPTKNIEVRVGVDALLEAYSNTSTLQDLIPQLATLSHHSDHRVRADACHLLGLSGSEEARSSLSSAINDPHAEVREIAIESLELLDHSKKTSNTPP